MFPKEYIIYSYAYQAFRICLNNLKKKKINASSLDKSNQNTAIEAKLNFRNDGK